MKVLIALGGNAMTGPGGDATPQSQIAAAEAAMAKVADLVVAGADVVITHGNGPQVGNLLVKNEIAATVVPPVPLDWCGAQTQATLGFILLDALDQALRLRGADRQMAAIVTRTLVDREDTGFSHPTKPIGRFLPEQEAALLVEHGQTWQDRGSKGWRRVVPSPEPLEILDAGAVLRLVEAGFVVVANGGGGIPVVREADGRLRGVEAVIDKDLGAALLARTVQADVLVIATDVENAVIGFGTPRASPVGEIEVSQLRRLAGRGTLRQRKHGTEGRCGLPVRRGQRGYAVITSLDNTLTPRPAGPARSYNPTHQESRVQMPDAIEVRKVALGHVSDASGLSELIDAGVIDADRVVAVIGKTEGNGGVNDYTRIIADRAFREVRWRGTRTAEEVAQVPIVWSGGTDGVISPHATMFATIPHGEQVQTDEPRLTVGFAMSELLFPEDIGRTAMSTKVATR